MKALIIILIFLLSCLLFGCQIGEYTISVTKTSSDNNTVNSNNVITDFEDLKLGELVNKTITVKGESIGHRTGYIKESTDVYVLRDKNGFDVIVSARGGRTIEDGDVTIKGIVRQGTNAICLPSWGIIYYIEEIKP